MEPNSFITIVTSLVDGGLLTPTNAMLAGFFWVLYKYLKGNGFAKQSDLAKSEERILNRLAEIERRIENSNDDHNRIDADLIRIKTKMGLEDSKKE